jgi:hypothetical protein
VAKEDEIRFIAYNIWEEENCPNGRDCEHWFRAEAIWEEQQKPRPVGTGTKTQPKQVDQNPNKTLPKRKRKS